MQGAIPRTSDPTLDVRDGSRAVEVSLLLGDSLLAVRYLELSAAPSARPLTLGLLAVSGVLAAAGCASLLLGLSGLAALAWILGVALGVYGALAWREQRRPPQISIGSAAEADLPLISPSLPTPCFPLVRGRGHELELIVAEGMAGQVVLGERRIDLSALRGSDLATPDGELAGAIAYPLPPDARVTLDLEPLTLVVRAVSPPRRPARPLLQRIDWRAQLFNGAALGAHAVVLLAMLAVPPHSRLLDADRFPLRGAIVTLAVQPPPPAFPRGFGFGPGDESGGTGRRHAGEEGRMGSPHVPRSARGLYRLRGPATNRDPHLARSLARADAAAAGVLGVLGRTGSHLASVLGRDSALGVDAENAMGGLIPNLLGSGEAYGVGGLGLTGNGRGGGCGDGCEGTIGLGTLGTIGRGGGGGSGAGYGHGVGQLVSVCGRSRGGRGAGCANVDVGIGAGAAVSRGSLDKEIIRRVVRRHVNEVKYCYEKELQHRWNFSGRLSVQFVIAGNGAVASSAVESSTLNNSAVESCVTMAVRRWMFPKPHGGGIVVVTYPFRLHIVGAPDD
jgi:hypothetical protein